MAVRIDELLLREQRLTLAQVEHARTLGARDEGSVARTLLRLGYVAEADLTALLSREYGVPSIDLNRFEIDASVVGLISEETARKYQVLPLARAGTTLTVAVADPADLFAVDDLRFMTGCHVETVVASEPAVLDALDRCYPRVEEQGAPGRDRDPEDSTLSSAATLGLVSRALEDAGLAGEQLELLAEAEQIDVESLERESGEAPVVRMVNLMLMTAVQRRASDIHVEPAEHALRVRFRVDGLLTTVMTPPVRLRDAFISRIKIMARLDIAEKRLPQDGRMKIRFAAAGATQVVAVRVSSLPTLYGEKIVLRLLDGATLRLGMSTLGLETESLDAFEAAIAKPWGMVLVTGPTGSGKTSTLYSAVSRLNTPDTNILTVEDPVEFNLPGINQVQVRDNIGLSFGAVLRAFLRQDPDVLLVGEIRDVETAGIAVRAALTGHLVLSTLHTNDAPSAVGRLVNLGVEPFLMASAVNLICAQRLVRRVCAGCAEDDPHASPVLLDAGFTSEEAARVVPRRGAGCKRCHQTGYQGRVGLYEVLEMTDAVRGLILRGAPPPELERAGLEQGMVTLRRSGLRKVLDGITTVAEVLRETVGAR